MSLNAPAGSNALPVKKTPALSLKGRECTCSRVTTLLHSCLTTTASVGIRTAEYPDAVTFVSYVAAYLPSMFSAFGAQLRDVFKLRYSVRLSSAGYFLYGSPKALLVPVKAFEYKISANLGSLYRV